MRKRTIALALVIVAALAFYASRPRALGVEVAEATAGEVLRTVSETGHLVPLRERTLFAETQFVVRQVSVKEGDRVSEGDVLLRGDTNDLNLRLAQADARLRAARANLLRASEFDLPMEVRQAEADLEAASIEYERAREKFEETLETYHLGGTTDDEWDALRDRYNLATARLNSAESALRRALGQASPEGLEPYRAEVDAISLEMESLREEISKCLVQAPFDGLVGGLDVEEGVVVLPGAQLATVFSTGLMVTCDVLARDMANVRVDQDVLVSGESLGDVVLTGRVSKVYPTAVERLSELGLRQRRVPIEVLLDTPEPQGALPGYPVDVDIVIHHADSVRIPKRAVFELNGQAHVFTIKGGRAVLTPVEVGVEGEDYVEVRSLPEGTLVIVSPPAELEPNQRVARE